MSSYHTSFSYLGKNSYKDLHLIVSHFDPDNGEMDSSLVQDQIYTESFDGKKRTLYGTKYNSVQIVKITLMKGSLESFTLSEVRSTLKWLTGNPEASWMDFYINDDIKYRLLCTIQDVKPQKLDAKTIGLNVYCESVSPWAFSPLQTINKEINGKTSLIIDNKSDDNYTLIVPKVTYQNSTDTEITITNNTIPETTKIVDLKNNEKIILDNNMIIQSDVPNKIFGDTFNFIWPQLVAGENDFTIIGQGNLVLEYFYPVKMGDCAITINELYGSICDGSGSIVVDTLPWNRITDTPTTLQGYGIQDAYTKEEINIKLNNLNEFFLIDEAELDKMLSDILV